ncbi:hypothetical protein B0H19DRAFT_439811 [Mycena capillaripes]|nr:hypothetical protein B0H19DRAFT_439811 [Mycena capillaripes]
MELLQVPFLIPDLVDHCIDFLYGSILDLRACSLVCRSWVNAAQSHIFRRILLSGDAEDMWEKLKPLLETSPHLTRYISRLFICPEQLSAQSFSDICNLSFTNLRSVCINQFSSISPSMVIAMQQLFSLPSLSSVTLWCLQWPARPGMWNRCSSLKHLFLYCTEGDPEQELTPSTSKAPPSLVPPTISLRKRVTLQSLCIRTSEARPGRSIDNWLTEALRPFDMSALNALSISKHPEIIRLEAFAVSLDTIELFEFVATLSEVPIDLSSFSNLAVLRMSLPKTTTLPMALQTLQTIRSPNRIRKIVVFDSTLTAAACGQLDAALASLPLQESAKVLLEKDTMWGYSEAELNALFLLLDSKNMLRQAFRDNDWLKSLSYTP